MPRGGYALLIRNLSALAVMLTTSAVFLGFLGAVIIRLNMADCQAKAIRNGLAATSGWFHFIVLFLDCYNKLIIIIKECF